MLSTIVPDASAQTIATSTPIPTATITISLCIWKLTFIEAAGSRHCNAAVRNQLPTSSISPRCRYAFNWVGDPARWYGRWNSHTTVVTAMAVSKLTLNMYMPKKYPHRGVSYQMDECHRPYNLAGSNGKGIRFWVVRRLNPGKTQVWTPTEPAARYWYPCHDTPNALHEWVTDNGWASDDSFRKKWTSGRIEELTAALVRSRIIRICRMRVISSRLLSATMLVQQETLGVKPELLLPWWSRGDAGVEIGSRIRMKFFADYTSVKYPYPSYFAFVQIFPGNAYGGMSDADGEYDRRWGHACRLSLSLGRTLKVESLAQQWLVERSLRRLGTCWFTQSIHEVFSRCMLNTKSVARIPVLSAWFDPSTDIFFDAFRWSGIYQRIFSVLRVHLPIQMDDGLSQTKGAIVTSKNFNTSGINANFGLVSLINGIPPKFTAKN